jgi:RNA polymerase sigma-70 factor, ECF subfamily
MDIREELERLHTASLGWAMACCGQRRREAEDVLQTVYLKVLEGRARFGGEASFRTWLFSVIRHTSAAARRQSWLHGGLLARWHREGSDDAAVDIEGGESRLQQARHIRAAVAQLSPRQQQVLHLVFYQDTTIEAAAQILGVSLGAARTHFERGKARMRVLLSQEASDEG